MNDIPREEIKLAIKPLATYSPQGWIHEQQLWRKAFDQNSYELKAFKNEVLSKK